MPGLALREIAAHAEGGCSALAIARPILSPTVVPLDGKLARSNMMGVDAVYYKVGKRKASFFRPHLIPNNNNSNNKETLF